MSGYKQRMSCWQGFPPPQYVYAHLEFKGIALEPPSTAPGSWHGGGKAALDHDERVFYLTGRPRKTEGDVRGFAVEIHRSADGISFEPVHTLTIEEVIELAGVRTDSIEGTQLLRDPLTG